jgi:hypothetical protein
MKPTNFQKDFYVKLMHYPIFIIQFYQGHFYI